MRDIKILHAADLHLDSPFEGLGAQKAAKRRAEQRQLLYRLAQLAVEEQADMVLLAGDLLDSDSAYAETAEELSRALGSIAAPVFISPGNHDYYSPRSPYARAVFTDNVHIFTSPEIRCFELPELGARVWGAAFVDKYSPALLDGFRADKCEGVRDIMCIHGEIDPMSRYNPMSEEQLAAGGMDYVAMGHIHKAGGLKRAGNTYYAWPGCPEGRGFDETGERFVYVVTLGEGCSIRPVCIAQRRYEILPVTLISGDALSDIRSAMPENTKNDVYRILLRGEADAAPDLPALRAALEGGFFALQLRDETVLRRNIWEAAGQDSLRGLFLAKLRRAYDAAETDADREKITQAARWGLAALEDREEVVRHGD